MYIAIAMYVVVSWLESSLHCQNTWQYVIMHLFHAQITNVTMMS